MFLKPIALAFTLLSLVFTTDAQQCLTGGCNLTTATLFPAATQNSFNVFSVVSTTCWAGEYSLYNVVSGQTYEWSTCTADGGLASYDSELTLSNNTSPATTICYSDDACGDDAKIQWTATFTGVARILLTVKNGTTGCQTNSENTTLVWRRIPPNTPLTYVSSVAFQTNDEVYKPLSKQQIMRLALEIDGSTGTLSATDFYLKTTGTTNVADIANARLYYTGIDANFNSTTQAGNTVAAPNGQFVVSGVNTNLESGVNYFWLTYDITTTATAGNLADATFDSVKIGGQNYVPTVTNPSEYKTIQLATIINQSATGNGGTSALGRAPATHNKFNRSVSLYPSGDLTFLNTGNNIITVGWNKSASAATQSVTGIIKIYVQNTTDANYNKGTAWTGIITGMTLVFDDTITISPQIGTYDIRLQTPITYTGGGLYIAYDWQIFNPATVPAANTVTYLCNSALVGTGNGNRSSISQTAAPANLGSSAFVPLVRLGVEAPANDASVDIVYTLSDVPNPMGSPHIVKALVSNKGSNTLVNYPVMIGVTGATTFADTQYVNLEFNQTTLVSFNPMPLSSYGSSFINVAVSPDDVLNNNSKIEVQNVTPNVFSYGAGGSTGSVGFNLGSGVLMTRYTVSGTWLVDTVNMFIANNTAAVGNKIFAAVVNASGNIIATSDTLTIATADINNWRSFKINNPQVVSNGNFYVGMAQTPTSTTTGYYPLGYQTETPVRTDGFFTMGLGGSANPNISQIGRYLISAVMNMPAPPIAVDLGPDAAICIGDSLLLDAGAGGTSYEWSTGAITPSIYVNTSGTYFVKVLNSQGFASYDTISVTVSNPVQVSVSISASSISVCQGDTAYFTATAINGGLNPFYIWTVNGIQVSTLTGDIFATSSLNNGDIVRVEIFSSECNTGPALSNTIAIQINPLPVADFTSNTVIDVTTFTNASIGSGLTYSWNFGDGNTSSLANPTHTYTANGTYNVVLIISNTCGADTVTKQVTITNVSVSENEISKMISVYPNPNNGEFLINFGSIQMNNAIVSVVDLNGKEFYSQNFNLSGSLRINLENLSTGFYYLRINNEKINVVKSISVVK